MGKRKKPPADAPRVLSTFEQTLVGELGLSEAAAARARLSAAAFALFLDGPVASLATPDEPIDGALLRIDAERQLRHVSRLLDVPPEDDDAIPVVAAEIARLSEAPIKPKRRSILGAAVTHHDRTVILGLVQLVAFALWRAAADRVMRLRPTDSALDWDQLTVLAGGSDALVEAMSAREAAAENLRSLVAAARSTGGTDFGNPFSAACLDVAVRTMCSLGQSELGAEKKLARWAVLLEAEHGLNDEGAPEAAVLPRLRSRLQRWRVGM